MVEASFYILSFVAVLMLLFLFRTYQVNKINAVFLGGSLVWILYLILLDQTGILKDFDFPPKVPVFIVFPAIIIILITINSKMMKQSLKITPLYLPVALQSFRVLVELLIYATYKEGIFPQRATFEGLNFDILVGLSAILVSILVSKEVIKNPGILIWNIAAICILTLTAFSFIFTYYFTDFGSSDFGYQFVSFPYMLLPSVLLVIAIFLHAYSIKQVLVRKASNN